MHQISCIKRSPRLLRSVPLISVVAIFCFLWMNGNVEVDHSSRDDSNQNVSIVSAVFRKHPVVIITKDRVQDEHLAEAVERSMQDRRDLVQKKCREGWRPHNDTLFKIKNLIYFDSRRKLGYCHSAKAGCTFWLRVFTFLTRRSELKYFGITSPFMIERIHLHTGSFSPHTASFWPQVESWILSKSFRFMFARNPFERLLSVFLDKHYLLGQSQTEFVASLICDNKKQLTFRQFLIYALNSSDHHLLPISELCNPCVYKPDAIGKMETFKSDAQYILDKGNYGYLLRHYNHSYRIEIELDSIVGENFEYLADIQSRHGELCMTAKKLSERLWNVFQYNGYIPSNLHLPDEGVSFTKFGLLTYMKKIIRENPMDEDQSKLQQKHYLYSFYSKVDKNLVDGIKDRYLGDFELFGYSTLKPTNHN